MIMVEENTAFKSILRGEKYINQGLSSPLYSEVQCK